MMGEKRETSKTVIRRMFIDWVVLLAGLLTILYYGVWAQPTKRGFFCDDTDLSYPFKNSTVSSAMLYTMAVFIPLGVVICFSAARTRRLHTLWWTFLADVYMDFIIWYGFGAVVTQAITYVLKFNVSRLRPHFFAVCQPDFAALKPLCTQNSYVADYNCTNPNVDLITIREAQISFPSGHASFGFHAAVFLVLYLHQRWDWVFTKSITLRPLLQISFLTAALFVALSRVNDFKHFPSDVLAGAVLGSFVAVFLYFTLQVKHFRDHYFYDGESSEGDTTVSSVGNGETKALLAGGVEAGGRMDRATSYKTFTEISDSMSDSYGS